MTIQAAVLAVMLVGLAAFGAIRELRRTRGKQGRHESAQRYFHVGLLCAAIGLLAHVMLRPLFPSAAMLLTIGGFLGLLGSFLVAERLERPSSDD